MTGLDCNILVQLAFADHPSHMATRDAIEREIARGEVLVFPSLIISEFLHVATDSRRFTPPLAMNEAIDWIEELLRNSNFKLIETSAESVGLALQWLRKFGLGRKRILDTQFACACHFAGARRLLTSNPGDFSVFGVFEIIQPQSL